MSKESINSRHPKIEIELQNIVKQRTSLSLFLGGNNTRLMLQMPLVTLGDTQYVIHSVDFWQKFS